MRNSSREPPTTDSDIRSLKKELFQAHSEIAALKFKITDVSNGNFFLAMKLFAYSSENRSLGGKGAREEAIETAERYFGRE